MNSLTQRYTNTYSPETNFDYILSALGFSSPGDVPKSTTAASASVGSSAVDEGVLLSLISQVKEVLSHLGDGFIRVRWFESVNFVENLYGMNL